MLKEYNQSVSVAILITCNMKKEELQMQQIYRDIITYTILISIGAAT